MSPVVLAFTIVSGLATAAMALFSCRLYKSNEEFRKWTVSQHEPEPVVVGGKVIHISKQARKFEFKLEVTNPGEGSIVLLGVGISQWGRVVFDEVVMQTAIKLVRPREMESLEFTLPLTDLPDGADLTEVLASAKRTELVANVTYQSGTRGVRKTSAKLHAHWFEPPFGGLADGVALLWPAIST